VTHWPRRESVGVGMRLWLRLWLWLLRIFWSTDGIWDGWYGDMRGGGALLDVLLGRENDIGHWIGHGNSTGPGMAETIRGIRHCHDRLWGELREVSLRMRARRLEWHTVENRDRGNERGRSRLKGRSDCDNH
jgi:hypothetical protein